MRNENVESARRMLVMSPLRRITPVIVATSRLLSERITSLMRTVTDPAISVTWSRGVSSSIQLKVVGEAPTALVMGRARSKGSSKGRGVRRRHFHQKFGAARSGGRGLGIKQQHVAPSFCA